MKSLLSSWILGAVFQGLGFRCDCVSRGSVQVLPVARKMTITIFGAFKKQFMIFFPLKIAIFTGNNSLKI
jgi:hypothetical protein